MYERNKKGLILHVIECWSIEVNEKDRLFYFSKTGQPRPLFRLFLVFSNKHHHKFNNKLMWKNVHSVYDSRIQTHNLRNVSPFP